MEQAIERDLNGGTQVLYRFDNGYGASLIRGGLYTYGDAELAVIKYYGDGQEDFKLCYTTPVTDDVLGYLTEGDVLRYLWDIKNLPNSVDGEMNGS